MHDIKDLSQLTKGEKLFLARRRTGMSQGQLAKMLQVSYNKYSAAERDLGEIPRTLQLESDPTLTEELILARRREGVGLAEASRIYGVSKVWYLHLEWIADSELIRLWQARGYKFSQ